MILATNTEIQWNSREFETKINRCSETPSVLCFLILFSVLRPQFRISPISGRLLSCRPRAQRAGTKISPPIRKDIPGPHPSSHKSTDDPHSRSNRSDAFSEKLNVAVREPCRKEGPNQFAKTLDASIRRPPRATEDCLSHFGCRHRPVRAPCPVRARPHENVGRWLVTQGASRHLARHRRLPPCPPGSAGSCRPGRFQGPGPIS